MAHFKSNNPFRSSCDTVEETIRNPFENIECESVIFDDINIHDEHHDDFIAFSDGESLSNNTPSKKRQLFNYYPKKRYTQLTKSISSPSVFSKIKTSSSKLTNKFTFKRKV